MGGKECRESWESRRKREKKGSESKSFFFWLRGRREGDLLVSGEESVR